MLKIFTRGSCDINLGCMLYSAYQVAKIVWLYEDWLNYEQREGDDFD